MSNDAEPRALGHRVKFRSFQYAYHDGLLASFTLGPRRELTMIIDLNPVWNKEKRTISVRLGGIQNFDEITSFFEALPSPPQPNAYIDEIIGLEYLGEGPNWVVINLVRHGHIRVKSHNVTES
jgi:hypothetical protein